MRNHDIFCPRYNQAEARIYLGSDIPNSAPAYVSSHDLTGGNKPKPAFVTEGEFVEFIAESVTPRFPGFTLTTGIGYWKGKPEAVRIISILEEDSDTFRQSCRVIGEHYKDRFNQEAVLVAFSDVQYGLVQWPPASHDVYHKAGLGY